MSVISTQNQEIAAVQSKCKSEHSGGTEEQLKLEEQMASLFLSPSDVGFDDKKASFLSSTLNEIEEKFLASTCVAAPNTTEAELAAFFGATSINEEPTEVKDYLENVLRPLVKDSVHCCAPTMIGHMTTSLPFYMRPLAKLLTTLHANTVKVETAKAQTFLEKEALAMLHREIFHLEDSFYSERSQLPGQCLGVVTSGGTIANNTAMWLARNYTLPAEGDFLGVDKQGLVAGLLHHGYKGAVIIGSKVMHYSMKKSADVLGIGIDGLLTCPYNDAYQVDLTAMRAALEDCKAKKIAVLSLVGVCGGTETGSIDDLDAIADLAKEYDVHFHVDAAWGGPVMFSKEHRVKAKGIERADTVTLDGHKQLYTPMGCGMCFLRDPEGIRHIEKTADYIIRKDSYDMGKFTMEGSRPAVSMFLHANLRIMGVSGYGALVDRTIRLVQHMVTALRATGVFETVLDPMTNILLYRYLPEQVRAASLAGKTLTAEENALVDAANVELQTIQKRAGSTFVSRTTIFSPQQQTRVVALRVVIANPRSSNADVDKTLEDQLQIVRSLNAAKSLGGDIPHSASAASGLSRYSL